MAKKDKGISPFNSENIRRVLFNPPDNQQFTEANRLEEDKLGRELVELRIQEKEEIRKLVPSCTSCGGEDIRVKTSSHLVSPGNNIFGPAGRGPRFSTHVDFLYCEDCGAVFYKSGVQKIQMIVCQILEKDEDLFRLRNPRRC